MDSNLEKSIIEREKLFNDAVRNEDYQSIASQLNESLQRKPSHEENEYFWKAISKDLGLLFRPTF